MLFSFFARESWWFACVRVSVKWVCGEEGRGCCRRRRGGGVAALLAGLSFFSSIRERSSPRGPRPLATLSPSERGRGGARARRRALLGPVSRFPEARGPADEEEERRARGEGGATPLRRRNPLPPLPHLLPVPSLAPNPPSPTLKTKRTTRSARSELHRCTDKLVRRVSKKSRLGG